ncbi:hypothetical protein [Candidatus Hakubella thermalkaliphila]|uniref:Multiple sugar transport system substrate-binding protein n=1 Tax=Candidatus Hakubella thermalkaliphila TaxID=2754717 RepID=A0A6V8P8I6_9ACTN|nr:hypothetical protein [Candidatus Hakubella thermalkaliphila]GFP26057.1 multiple sugar transport system substrate-binding protein [Candidatus Hakubella thermalkaliphila]GFP27984.1 multiple sugar transport system substrate-binding protein [Candidatus Hakubella thermalkaliphila]GFP42532.1 multiple sugar transport system substrate-binding protein [Candidatus Hakubella thermalkaliphila]
MERHWKLAIPIILVVLAAAVLGACVPAPPPAEEVAPPVEEVTPEEPVEEVKQFEGVEINVLTFTGPQIAEPLLRRGPDFEALTGAKVNVVTVPFADLYPHNLD